MFVLSAARPIAQAVASSSRCHLRSFSRTAVTLDAAPSSPKAKAPKRRESNVPVSIDISSLTQHSGLIMSGGNRPYGVISDEGPARSSRLAG